MTMHKVTPVSSQVQTVSKAVGVALGWAGRGVCVWGGGGGAGSYGVGGGAEGRGVNALH